ncbi:ABC transporter substrate-binding protein [Vibrio penaeicida]|uniref:ABC transporter substrate-binding protein n=1 Tax=Vibrio penaeicida TaxID=104609 RepID=UPI002733F35D|nr:ABC transporter substrate-binding protein [Vibrio penaeicida]MDP2572187.1 ABC transporter substrate-binding protein [Vibrio penaeicida]
MNFSHRLLGLFATLFVPFYSSAGASSINIYLDADRSNYIESARSIEQGIKTAFQEVDNTIQGREVNFVVLDHKGNSVRSKKNMVKFLNDPNALVLFAGLHSPPLIKYREYINKSKILILVPWAAGAPITRYPSKENWVFRLSVDDKKAGERMASFAVKNRKCKAPHLLLEETPWGKSNQRNMTVAIKNFGLAEPNVTWFNWGINESGARIKIREIRRANADCILMVSNASEGVQIVNAMASFPLGERLPVVSHWGITGGDFAEKAPHTVRSRLDLYVIQTCFSFLSSSQTAFSSNVLKRAIQLFPSEIQSATDINAPTGFIHGYDLSRVLIQALSQISLSDDMETNRSMLRLALENIDIPVKGLVKTYHKPFHVFSTDNPDAHEALGLEDLCMAKFNQTNNISVIQKQ